jgi:ankyrin repeat protein
VLLDHGADPNHADNAGATALIWAIPNEPKVRLLLERGARVNTASKLTGRTPLLIAAGRPGAAAVVQLLLEKGADPKARDIRGESTIFRAAFSGDMEVLRLLVDRGADVNARTNENFTALMEAAVHGNGSMIEMLLSRAADTKAHDEEGNTALTSANDYHDFTLFRLLISKGADPGYRNMAGQDLLMAAASSDSSSPEVIREMINLPLDPTIRSANFHISHGLAKDSEGPLDWARRHGDTPVTRVLAELSGDQPRRDAADESARLNATTPRAAIEKAVPLLYAGGAEFFKRSGCTSCHHNVLPALVFSHARIKGIVVDEEKVRRNYLQSVAWIKGRQEMLYQDVRFPGGDTTASYLLWGLDADGHKRDRATDAVIHHLGAAQAIDGGWRVRADRPPIESGRVTPTALSIHALRLYAIPGRKVEFDARIRRAARWLSTYRARTGEEKAMRLLGLTWAEASSGSIRDAAAQLSAAQRPDGGWAQLETLPSDAYATGQALYALHTAGQLRDQALQKGVRFLLQNQLADGSWHVRSRSYPIQSLYFDTGFPHGRDQWISAAGTSWACIALSLAIEP